MTTLPKPVTVAFAAAVIVAHAAHLSKLYIGNINNWIIEDSFKGHVSFLYSVRAKYREFLASALFKKMPRQTAGKLQSIDIHPCLKAGDSQPSPTGFPVS